MDDILEEPESKKRKIVVSSDAAPVRDVVEPVEVMQARKLAIYTFHCDLGRMWDLCGTFLQDIQKVEDAKSQDYTVYFGEVLGKHSDIRVTFSRLHVQKITDDEKLVNAFEEILRLANKSHFGYNPFEFDTDDDNDDDDSGS